MHDGLDGSDSRSVYLMETWRQVAGMLGVALLFEGGVTNAAELTLPRLDTDEMFEFDLPALPLHSAVERFATLVGKDIYVGPATFEACGNFVVPPIKGRYTASEAWSTLTAPICATSGIATEGQGAAPVYMVDHPWVAEREILIPSAPLVEALRAVSEQFGGVLLDYRARDLTEAQTPVGPIAGHMGPEEALNRIEAQLGSSVSHRPLGKYGFVLEPNGDEDAQKLQYLYGRKCACPVAREPVRSATVVVTGSAITAFERGGVVTFTRQDIESTGANTLPQFFRYIAQNGTSRPVSNVASGAQYADFRGLGRDTHLVTINGHRTLPSANNVTSSAFDLNTIPLPAVERVEFRLDSASMRYGSDAIAGTINIVTRRTLEGALTLKYGEADGGGEERRSTLSFGRGDSEARFAVMADYLAHGELPGHARPFASDQDYTSEGGLDYRTNFAIRSLDGAALPGLSSPLAGWPAERASDALSVSELTPGVPQKVSLSKYQSLVPASDRLSVLSAADYTFGGLKLSADVLWVKRHARYQYFPAMASGIVSAKSSTNPFNPFDEPVWVDALLTGAPSMQQHVTSELRRGVVSAQREMSPWRWDLAVIASQETALAWVDHMLDPQGLAAALSPPPQMSSMSTVDEASAPLNVFAMHPGGLDAPERIWARAHRDRFASAGWHVLGSVGRRLAHARLQIGVEKRAEAMRFSADVGRVERDVLGAFTHLELPLVRADRNWPGMREFTALVGVRHDDFSDVEAVTLPHLEFKWRLTDRLRVDANVAEQYRPPSLFELNIPRITIPVQIFDPKRGEGVSTVLFSGGNRALLPTRGHSTNIEARYGAEDAFQASLNYFSIRLSDRIASSSLRAILAAEDQIPKRIVRAPTEEEVAAGRPGRIASIDATWNNVGRLFTSGVDASVTKRFETTHGTFTPRIAVTWIDSFRYSDSSVSSAPMIDRVGLAAEQGTITRWRAVGSLGWQRDAWAATAHLRWIPGYADVGGGGIDSQRLWDLNVSYEPNPHVTWALNIVDLADTSPHFAKVGAATGYDTSQWDPVGRRVLLTAKVRL